MTALDGLVSPYVYNYIIEDLDQLHSTLSSSYSYVLLDRFDY